MGRRQDVVIVDEGTAAELAAAVHEGRHEGVLVGHRLEAVDNVEEGLVLVVGGDNGAAGASHGNTSAETRVLNYIIT